MSTPSQGLGNHIPQAAEVLGVTTSAIITSARVIKALKRTHEKHTVVTQHETTGLCNFFKTYLQEIDFFFHRMCEGLGLIPDTGSAR